MKFFPCARAVAIGLLASLLCGIAHSQRRERSIFQFQHTAWTAKDGAPSIIWALAQTTDGFLWMGTESGLYRFDGLQFELYQPLLGQHFKSTFIWSLKATPDGGLWIGYAQGGADFLKKGRITSYGEAQGLPIASVTAFALDHDRGLWAMTQKGLYRFDGSRWIVIRMSRGFRGSEAGHAMLVDREGTLWVATDSGLFFLRRGEHDFRECAEHLGNIRKIGQTLDGTLWLSLISSNRPGSEWTVRTIRRTPLLPAPDDRPLPRIMEIDAVSSSVIDRAGSLWIATTNGMFRVPDPERLEVDKSVRLDASTAQQFQQKDGLSSDKVASIAEDVQGDIWAGTTAGLDRFRESNVVPLSTNDWPRPLLVAGNNGDAWANATTFPENWLVRLHGLTETKQRIPFQPTAGYRDRNEVLWLGEPRGLWKLDKGNLVHGPLPMKMVKGESPEVHAITEDAAGGIWISILAQSPFYWSRGVWTRLGNHPGLPTITPVSLFTDSAGRIWFGYSTNGVVVLNGDRVTAYGAKDGLHIPFIQAFYERAGHIWIGGARGLALFRDNRMQTFTPAGNVEFTGVSGIVETPNGDLWLNATPGILHISAAEIERAIREPTYRVRCEVFGSLDGLVGKAVQLRPIPSEVMSSDGRLWFSTNAGIFQIDPARLLRNTVAPAIEIQSLDSGGVTYPPARAIRLPAHSTDVPGRTGRGRKSMGQSLFDSAQAGWMRRPQWYRGAYGSESERRTAQAG